MKQQTEVQANAKLDQKSGIIKIVPPKTCYEIVLEKIQDFGIKAAIFVLGGLIGFLIGIFT